MLLTTNRYPVVICVVTTIHIVWAIGLLVNPASHYATAVHALVLTATHPGFAATALVCVSCLALLGLRLGPKWWWLIVFQQMILVMSAVGCINAMYLSQFADGVIRDRWFLIVDQVAIVALAAGHSISLYLFHGRDTYG
jgi:hypothetical protein